MNKDTILDQLCKRYPLLSQIRESVGEAAEALIKCYESGGKLLACGNGGSSADSEHIVGELMKSFELQRPVRPEINTRLGMISPERGAYIGQKLETGFPAVALSAHTALTTAICNDIDPDLIFAQQILGYGKPEDILIAFSTSGDSQNIIDASITAKALQMEVIAITGRSGGKLREYCDILINVPEGRTAFVQELHLPVLHAICLIVEDHFFNTENQQK